MIHLEPGPWQVYPDDVLAELAPMGWTAPFAPPLAAATALPHPVLQRLQALTWREIEQMDPDDLRTLLDSLATAARAG